MLKLRLFRNESSEPLKRPNFLFVAYLCFLNCLLEDLNRLIHGPAVNWKRYAILTSVSKRILHRIFPAWLFTVNQFGDEGQASNGGRSNTLETQQFFIVARSELRLSAWFSNSGFAALTEHQLKNLSTHFLHCLLSIHSVISESVA
jgi:hypothetical protein